MLMQTYGIQVIVGEERELLVRIDGGKGGRKDPQLATVVKELAVETHFSEKEIMELHEIFVAMDHCEDQIFSSSAIGKEIMKRCNIPSGIADFFFDADDETIPFPVMVFIASVFARGSKQERLAYLFSAIDQNSSGNLSKDEVERVVVALLLLKGGTSANDAATVNNAVEKIWAIADSDGDSSLSFVEFLEHADTCVELLGLKEIFSVHNTTLQYLPSTRLSSASSSISAPASTSRFGNLLRNNTIGSFFNGRKSSGSGSRKNSLLKKSESAENEQPHPPEPETAEESEGTSTPAVSPPPLTSADSKGSFWSKLKEKRNTEPIITRPPPDDEHRVASAEAIAIRAVNSSLSTNSKESNDDANTVQTPTAKTAKKRSDPEPNVGTPTSEQRWEPRPMAEPGSALPKYLTDRSESIVSGSGLAKVDSTSSSASAMSALQTPSAKGRENHMVWEITEAEEDLE